MRKFIDNTVVTDGQDKKREMNLLGEECEKGPHTQLRLGHGFPRLKHFQQEGQTFP